MGHEEGYGPPRARHVEEYGHALILHKLHVKPGMLPHSTPNLLGLAKTNQPTSGRVVYTLNLN
ncbi:hypothetical protein apy_09230 [Aeropyrum pernix]|uniref:Uncharacterized protein n=1 Tax=Aeropyrum pernix TaxID=56636 RepID=A0A401HA03_AERPX|nr:hypothetical protein apy_09230 [Aeropyrum pernix]